LRLPARRAFVAGMFLMLAAAQLPVQTQTRTAASKQHSSAKTKGRRHARKGSWKRHGQQGIQPQRAREIQEALIREHYLTGEATGVWDARSQAAMTRYQADNGWQSKVTPDSRALIKLGLGPNYADKDMYKATSAAASTPAGSSTRQ
jgi:peptidoglycan hydrolase-like protein with peptidoglycan-binding domain